MKKGFLIGAQKFYRFFLLWSEGEINRQHECSIRLTDILK
jgi:hypothetical protein